MQFLVKLQAIGLMQLYKKISSFTVLCNFTKNHLLFYFYFYFFKAPSRLFFRDLSADFSTNSLGKAISGKPTSLERLQWLYVRLLLFLFPNRHLPVQSQPNNTGAACFTVRFFNDTMLTLSRPNRYVKNYIGGFFFKAAAAKEIAYNSFFPKRYISYPSSLT